MKTTKLNGTCALLLAAITLGAMSPARADGAAATPAAAVAAFWTVQKADGKLALVMVGQKDPVVTTVSDTTVFGGICLDCSLPMEFKTGEVAKKCAVCGCAVSNATCIVGKPVKSNTWQEMLQMLPHGAVLTPTFNTADKPESGLKKLIVTLRTVLLPVSGLDSQTPAELLALVKPLGGTTAELLDGGKLLSIKLKSDWTVDRATRLEAALGKINAKEVVFEAPKTAQ